jgi:hypothetical protein
VKSRITFVLTLLIGVLFAVGLFIMPMGRTIARAETFPVECRPIE